MTLIYHLVFDFVKFMITVYYSMNILFYIISLYVLV